MPTADVHNCEVREAISSFLKKKMQSTDQSGQGGGSDNSMEETRHGRGNFGFGRTFGRRGGYGGRGSYGG